MTRGLSPAGL